MKQKYLQEAKAMARNLGYHDAVRRGTWNGYEVVEPVFTDNEMHIIGLPQYILYKDGRLKWTEGEEGLKIMSALID